MSGEFQPKGQNEREPKVNLTPEIIDTLAEMALTESTTMTPELRANILERKARVDQERGENND